MILVVHPVGSAFVRATLAALRERDLLAAYATTLAFHERERWIERLPARLSRQLARRRYALPPEQLQRRPLREAVRLMAGPFGTAGLRRHESGWASVDAVCRDLDRHAARQLGAMPGLRGVYGYEDAAGALFAAARGRGLARCYDLPIGYWREAQKIFAEEAALQPEWASTLDGLNDSAEKLARKDAELGLASRIIVASEFTRSTLAAFPGTLAAPVSVVPYGAPVAVSEEELKRRLAARAAGGLRVLYVGSLSQRKGLSYLFAAMRKLGPEVNLTVVGRPPPTPCAALQQALGRHRHVPTLASPELFALMREHDVLVLPSLFEGFGLVLLEAMAQGLPVIATPHTAAPDLLRGAPQAGLIVPIRSVDALAAGLEELSRDDDRREHMALTARRVAEGQTWARYGAEIAGICREAMATGGAV